MAPSPATRRLRRSPRLTGAITLLFLAAAMVLAAAFLIPSQMLLVRLAAVSAVGVGAIALALVIGDVRQQRRLAQADRARQARDYLAMATERSLENVGFVHTLTSRLAVRQRQLSELAAEAELHRTRRDEATSALARAEEALHAERTRGVTAAHRIVELERQVADLKAELVAWADAARPIGDKRRTTA